MITHGQNVVHETSESDPQQNGEGLSATRPQSHSRFLAPQRRGAQGTCVKAKRHKGAQAGVRHAHSIATASNSKGRRWWARRHESPTGCKPRQRRQAEPTQTTLFDICHMGDVPLVGPAALAADDSQSTYARSAARI